MLATRAEADVDAVLSDRLGWAGDGVDILGDVPINTGGSLVEFPVRHFTLRYLRRTTSTAVCVSHPSRLFLCAWLTSAALQPDLYHWFLGQHRCCEAECDPLRLHGQP